MESGIPRRFSGRDLRLDSDGQGVGVAEADLLAEEHDMVDPRLDHLITARSIDDEAEPDARTRLELDGLWFGWALCWM